MRELSLKSRRFREEREQDWRRLETLLDRMEGRGKALFKVADRLFKLPYQRLDEGEILELAVLYRAALSSLSVARATSLDHATVDYLESLCARAYFIVYGTRTRFFERLARFFAVDWPAAAQALWRETLVATGLGLLGVAAAWLLVGQDADWYFAFVDPMMAGGRDPTATTQYLRSTLFDAPEGKDKSEGLSVLATGLFTHNAGVAMFSFALGFAFCLPTAYLMLTNGLMLGAFLRLFASHGLGVELGGWLFIHGVTELWAITLAGAAGFRIGWAVAFPGLKTRVEAAGQAGRQAATLMCGAMVMLFFAGLLEGFARQLVNDTVTRYVVAGASAVLWGAYLYAPRRRRAGES